VVATLALEARIAGLLAGFEAAEEGLEGLVQAAEHVLQDLGVGLGVVGTRGFQVRQLHGLLVVGGALALAALPPGLALFEGDVI
jgi:hypothetical protein